MRDSEKDLILETLSEYADGFSHVDLQAMSEGKDFQKAVGESAYRKSREDSINNLKDHYFFKILRKPVFWGLIFSSIPLFLALVVLAVSFQLEDTLGDSISFIEQRRYDSDFVQIADSLGFSDMPGVIEAYQYRWLIMATLFALSVLVFVIIVLVPTVFRGGRVKKVFSRLKRGFFKVKGTNTDH